ncbi:MAG: DUF3301 domain-containing protein [Gammaproteobacteria bacterium]|uniref:DUF3301 domain-containing protein n=1 Tax=Tolumonas osonensis TaxID=675874 RepID=A0A841GHP0_9GAMM|nr:DUF3301 domain-containing protein [Tolumonas osonensis]MBB6054400.1 hypothetical protein [Tolumonas osonensis]NCB60074.1 DUF3301 domain-containing protein [Gammaproteobacteria bacterium]
MTDLLLFFVICLIGAEAWQRRQQSELAERLIRHYCQNANLQLLSVARQSFGIPLFLAQVTQKANAFVFEYSADGVSKEEGELYLTGLHQPVFRVNPAGQNTNRSNGTDGIVINMPANHENHDVPPVKSDHNNNVIPFTRKRH